MGARIRGRELDRRPRPPRKRGAILAEQLERNTLDIARIAAVYRGRPVRRADTHEDGRLGAVIEHAAITHGYKPPAWVDEPERFLATPVNLNECETDSDPAWQPGAFLWRGVGIDSRDLDHRTGDGRLWTARLD